MMSDDVTGLYVYSTTYFMFSFFPLMLGNQAAVLQSKTSYDNFNAHIHF